MKAERRLRAALLRFAGACPDRAWTGLWRTDMAIPFCPAGAVERFVRLHRGAVLRCARRRAYWLDEPLPTDPADLLELALAHLSEFYP